MATMTVLEFPPEQFSLFFLSTSHSDASYEVSSQLAFRLRRRENEIFLDGGHLGLRIGTILAIFALQDTQRLPIKFQVSCPFGSGEEAN